MALGPTHGKSVRPIRPAPRKNSGLPELAFAPRLCDVAAVNSELARAASERRRALLERYARRIRRENLQDRLILALGALAALAALAAFCGVLP